MAESYLCHVGSVLDLLISEKTMDPISLSFTSHTPLPLDYADSASHPLIQKVDTALQKVVQKMLLLEQELARVRYETGAVKTTGPANTLLTDVAMAPPILTPPVDALSPSMSANTRWGDGSWFVNHTTSFNSVQERPPLPSISSALSESSNSSEDFHTPLGTTPLQYDLVAMTQDTTTTTTTAPRPLHAVPAAALNTVGPFSSDIVAPAYVNGVSDGNKETQAQAPNTLASITNPSVMTCFPPILNGQDSAGSMGSPLRTFSSPSSSSLPSSTLSSSASTTASTTAALSSTTRAKQDRRPCQACIQNCANIAAAVMTGDLSGRVVCGSPECQGSDLIVSINDMVSKLSKFTQEVIEVAAQGVEGKLGVQADVEGESGIWKEFISHLNSMTASHSEQVRDIAHVCTAVAHGDLSQKIKVSVKGETLVLKNTINTMVDQLRSFSSEVTRVAHEVGTEGKLGGQAYVKDVSGTWKELMYNVNTMAANLTAQVRDIASVSKAIVKGDLSKKISVEVKGEMHDLKHTINTMVDQLQEFALEVSRVSLEVGTEGKLGGQAHVKDVSGTGKELTDNVNLMASNLTTQVRDIATVCKAVACGDLTRKIDVQAQGEILELKVTMNTMVDQLQEFAAEVTRVAGEVGTEGKLGGQAEVEGIDGTWKMLTDNVNTMAANLTAQVRDIASVSKAVAAGDLSKKVTVEVKGEMLDLKHTINIMVDQLQQFATEVTRVSLEVGTEGKLGGQALVKDVSGTWKELTDNVNTMAANLTTQVRSIAEVTTAVACGDLSKTIDVQAQGEISELKLTVNSMVEQLRTFAAEVTRVAREVGTEGRLGGQAQVKGVDGTWKELTDNVNTMAANLTAQVRDIANVSKAIARGDLSKKVTIEVKGEMLDLKDTINIMVDQLQEFATEVSRVSLEVGTEGKLGGQAVVKDVSGTWKELTDNVNTMAANLTTQVRSIAEVTTAVACGDLSKTIDVQAQGEISEVKLTVNSMVEQLRMFAAEVTRVAREVGTEGSLGGQALVKGVDGTWKELTDNVNTMAANLTAQVRDIAAVSKAVARGDLTQKISVDARGEILELKNTINIMVDQLSTFSAEVTRVAREVGTEGKLGGQAVVKDVSGTWKELTDNVNTMASNLTTQVRSIAEVTTAVACGDLSKTIDVQAQGEISELKLTVNSMVEQLRTFAAE
ncbi:hypothetical protein BGZ73_002468, partial [Actinomortierella ambigua]